MYMKKQYTATVYKANRNEFERFCSNDALKFVGNLEESTIYFETIVSRVDIKKKIEGILEDVSNKNIIFEEKIITLDQDLCRIIFNEKKECIFLQNENVEEWDKFALENGLKRLIMIDEIETERIRNNQISNLTEIEAIINSEHESGLVSFKGNNLEISKRYEEYAKNITEVKSFSRRLENYDIEIKPPNVIKVTTAKHDLVLKKTLSRAISRG